MYNFNEVSFLLDTLEVIALRIEALCQEITTGYGEGSLAEED